MAKYRLLSDEELKELEEDFVKYLVVNGIDAEQWEQLKQNDADKALRIVDLFSDVVFEKILREILFLDFHSSAYFQSIQCLENKMITVAVERKDPSTDLLNVDLNSISLDDVNIYRGEKKYVENREKELFELIQKGYQINQGDIFKQLILKTV